MRTVFEINDEQAQIRAKVAPLLVEAEGLTKRSADRLTDEQQAKFDRLTAKVTEYNSRLDMLHDEELEAIQEIGRHPENLEGVDHDPARVARYGARHVDEATRTRDQALRAIDTTRNIPGNTPEALEHVAKLLDEERDAGLPRSRGDQAVAELIEATASPDYRNAWAKHMADPVYGHRMWNTRELAAWQRGQEFMSQRAMNEGSTTTGAALVPYFLDPTIVLTNAGVVSPIRGLASVKQITTNIWHGVTSAGVNAEWIGEATEVSDASPSLAQPTIQTYKADAYLQASMELIADASLSGEIAALLAEAKGRLEATAFAVGTGTNQPRGIITASSGGANQVVGSSGASGSADLVAADVFNVANALPARYRAGGRAAWLASYLVINKIRALNIATSQTSTAFWADFADDQPSKLIGFPIHEVSDMDSTIVSGSNDDILLFGDISSYYIVDRMGLELTYNPLVLGANRRPTGESGWVAFWRQGGDMVNSGAARILMI